MVDEVVAVEGTKGVMQPDRSMNILLEDIFPPLDISAEGVEDELKDWFDNDLKRCARFVNSQVEQWDDWRKIYEMGEIEQVYPNISVATFPSGLLCEKVNEAMDRIKRAVFLPNPLFSVDMDVSDIQDIDQVHRMENFFDGIFRHTLKVKTTLGNEALFDYIMDGSLIVEPETIFRVVPRRTTKRYRTTDDLKEDEALVAFPSMLSDMYATLAQGGVAKAVVEVKTDEGHGLDVIVVNKIDHLIPPNIHRDKDIRFRARRIYFTETDLHVMASRAVNWYKQKDVDAVIGFRSIGLSAIRANDGVPDFDRMKPEGVDGVWLGYSWDTAMPLGDELKPGQKLPYQEMYHVYRITARYAYPTQEDPRGIIPKLCQFDYEPDSRTILRARVYPHLQDRMPWIHFKLGHRPENYYGAGFGFLICEEDVRQSNILNLFLDAAANASFPPYLSKHPEYGGITPFRGGMGPGEVGYVAAIGDFKALDIPLPAESLIKGLYPISTQHAENRTSITSYSMGQVETYDPRSPARKAELLLGQAQISIESMIDDWNVGWEQLAQFVWMSVYETVEFAGIEAFRNVVEGDVDDLTGTAKVTVEELASDIVWESQASSMAINPEQRKAAALKQFSFFAPLLQQLGQTNPPLFVKYFHRWMMWMAMQLELKQAKWLIPTVDEIGIEGGQAALGEMEEGMKTGAESPPPQPPPEEALPEMPTEGGE